MLKITITETATEQRFILQGRLTESCVSELRASWTNARDARGGRRCIVDLDDVTFIDQSGVNVLLEMLGQGVQFVSSGVCTKQLLSDLKSQNKHSLRKCLE